jgi:hypothetical protein
LLEDLLTIVPEELVQPGKFSTSRLLLRHPHALTFSILPQKRSWFSLSSPTFIPTSSIEERGSSMIFSSHGFGVVFRANAVNLRKRASIPIPWYVWPSMTVSSRLIDTVCRIET